MTEHQILCIKKTGRMGPDDRIEFVGTQIDDGTMRHMSQSEAVTALRNGIIAFTSSCGEAIYHQDCEICQRKRVLKMAPGQRRTARGSLATPGGCSVVTCRAGVGLQALQ